MVTRWGFLGPRATTAAFVQPGGRLSATHDVDPETSGAYLFVQTVDPKRFHDAQRFEREFRVQFERRTRVDRSGAGDTPESSRLPRQVREAEAYARAFSEAARARRRGYFRAQQAEAVDATFAGARSRRVAGPGQDGGPLPGVTPDYAPTSRSA